MQSPIVDTQPRWSNYFRFLQWPFSARVFMRDVTCSVRSQESGIVLPVEERNNEAVGWQDLSAYNLSVYHQLYECDIYSWLAVGAVKVNQRHTEVQYFLYCEYRDRRSASQYVVYSFTSLDKALCFQRDNVIRQVLPDICPEQTARYPVNPGCSDAQ